MLLFGILLWCNVESLLLSMQSLLRKPLGSFLHSFNLIHPKLISQYLNSLNHHFHSLWIPNYYEINHNQTSHICHSTTVSSTFKITDYIQQKEE